MLYSLLLIVRFADVHEKKNIHLLPGNRIFLVGWGYAALSHYLDVKETTSLPSYYFKERTFTYHWGNSTLGFREDRVSQPFYCSDSIRFTFRAKKDIYGLIISCPHDLPPTEEVVEIWKLVPFPDLGILVSSTRPFIFGYNKALSLSTREKSHLISYSWPDDVNRNLPPLWLHKKKIPFTEHPLMDEESGRVVVAHEVITILDYGLIYKHPALLNTKVV